MKRDAMMVLGLMVLLLGMTATAEEKKGAPAATTEKKDASAPVVTECANLCEAAAKCPGVDKEAAKKGMPPCLKACGNMKDNLRPELAKAFFACAVEQACGSNSGDQPSNQCMMAAMQAAVNIQLPDASVAKQLADTYCEAMMKCMSQSGVPQEMLAMQKEQCVQAPIAHQFALVLSQKGMDKLTACLKNATCEQLEQCFADIFGLPSIDLQP